MLNVTLYTRKDCKLCDEVKEQLNELQSKYPHRLVEVDIDLDPALIANYGQIIPVIEVGPYRLKAPITPQNLQMNLGAAFDRKNQLEKLGDPEYQMRIKKGKNVNTGDRVSFWIAKRYLLLLNLFMLFYVGLPFLAPTLMKMGAELPAKAIYRIYSPLCHQFGFRSFFLYGEQAYYPLAEANVAGVKTFEQATGIVNLDDPYSFTRFESRAYIGDETVGYKVALFERDVAIYLAILLFGIVFGLTGRRVKSLHWALWLLIGIGPIGLDGFSQLLSQFDWAWLASIIPYRESTPFLRAFTGALFGLATAWFAYPNIEESMSETRQYYIKKFAVHEASQ
ncbi:MAG: glutaredoxin family protein [Anaerolineales bacterium]|uniref:glutaredoxin family protein n=1 Tax=Candidatus Villigracilis proximus TaxID=3140683 RepID=UPI003136E3C5|nr:glutaredoxin family protein [Anaerolineales bacterium]